MGLDLFLEQSLSLDLGLDLNRRRLPIAAERRTLASHQPVGQCEVLGLVGLDLVLEPFLSLDLGLDLNRRRIPIAAERRTLATHQPTGQYEVLGFLGLDLVLEQFLSLDLGVDSNRTSPTPDCRRAEDASNASTGGAMRGPWTCLEP